MIEILHFLLININNAILIKYLENKFEIQEIINYVVFN